MYVLLVIGISFILTSTSVVIIFLFTSLVLLPCGYPPPPSPLTSRCLVGNTQLQREMLITDSNPWQTSLTLVSTRIHDFVIAW